MVLTMRFWTDEFFGRSRRDFLLSICFLGFVTTDRMYLDALTEWGYIEMQECSVLQVCNDRN